MSGDDATDSVIQDGPGYRYWAAEEDEAPDYESLLRGEISEIKAAQKKRRVKTGRLQRLIKRAVTFTFLALVAYVGYNFHTVYSQASLDQRTESDAIIVLGAAQFDGEPSPVFAARLDQAYILYASGIAKPVLTTGSNQEGDRFTEGFSGYTYLLERGVADSDLIPIVDGSDTYQQLSASALQLQERGLERAVLVSDSYHNARLKLIAKELGLDVTVAPRDDEPTWQNYARETAAISLGRLVGFRRVSAWDVPG